MIVYNSKSICICLNLFGFDNIINDANDYQCKLKGTLVEKKYLI